MVSNEEIQRSRGSIICTGSQNSNTVVADILNERQVAGDPHRLSLCGKTFNLPINYALEGDGSIRRMIDGEWRTEDNYKILFKDAPVGDSEFGGDEEPQTGHLIFSKLPHPNDPDRVAVIWAGNIGPATEAMHLVFDSGKFVTIGDLEELAHQASETPYYQIKFFVDEIHLNRKQGRHIARSLYLPRGGFVPVVQDPKR